MEFLNLSDIWGWIELAATVLGIIYVVLEIMQKVSMWYFNIFCALGYVAIGIHNHLWGSMTLNAYYVAISFLGIYRLTRDKAALAAEAPGDKAHDIVVRRLPRRTLVASSLMFLLLAAALYFLFSLDILSDPSPNLDAVTMTLSFIGTYWLTQSYIQVWYVWIIADILQIALFASQGMFAPAFMFVAYLAASIYGYFHWRKHMTVID